MISYKNTISGGSSIMQSIRIPENTRNDVLVMNLIADRYRIVHICSIIYNLSTGTPDLKLSFK